MKIVLDENAFMPVRIYGFSAGFDLRTPKNVTIYPGESVAIDLGIRVEIPEGYFGKLESNPTLNINRSIVSLGYIIDTGYTGNIVAKLHNFGKEECVLEAGEKVVKLIIQSYMTPNLEVQVYDQ